jgi:hypothetical protein
MLLRDYWDGRQRCRLCAILDELTLTYDVVSRASDGRERALRRHIASLREARRWALAFADAEHVRERGRAA